MSSTGCSAPPRISKYSAPPKDAQARPAALTQLGNCDPSVATDIALHVDLWLVDRRRDALRWIHDTGGTDLTLDDLDLIAELLLSACTRD